MKIIWDSPRCVPLWGWSQRQDTYAGQWLCCDLLLCRSHNGEDVVRTLFRRAMQRTTGRQTTAAILQRVVPGVVIEHKRSIIREAVGSGAVDTVLQDLWNTAGDMVPPRFWVNKLLNSEIHCDFETEPYPAVVVQSLSVDDWSCFEDAVMRRVATLATLQHEALDYQMSEYNAADYEDFDEPDDSYIQALESI